MLYINNQPLSHSLLSYIAFRLACRDTLERFALWQQFGREHDEGVGYLAEIPWLSQVAVPVQLELLASCWRRHIASERFDADLVDEAVVFAVCELAAALVENEALLARSYLRGGPLDLGVPLDLQLAAELRQLFLVMPSQAEFLVVGQLLDTPVDERAAMYAHLGITESHSEQLFELLSRWRVSGDFQLQFHHLLTEREQQQALELLRPYCMVTSQP